MTPHNFEVHPSARRASTLSIAILGAALVGSAFTARTALGDENSIRDHLARTGDTAYLQQDNLRLERLDAAPKGMPGAVVFQKYIDGIPLHGGYVYVFESSDGQVERVIDHPSAGLRLDATAPALNAKAAENSIKTNLATGSTSQQVWFRTGNEASLAWEVTTSLADSGKPVSPTALETVIDGLTGAILSQRQIDTKSYATAGTETVEGVFPRIVINDAVGPAGSRAFAAPFDNVVASSVGCTGTLIAPNVVLSARHCGIGAGSQMIFGDNSGAPVFTIGVQSSILPAGGGTLLDGGDVSIHILAGNVPGGVATPMRLISEDANLVGEVAITLGYGFNGVGSVGHQFSSDGRRWGGENLIDVYGTPAANFGSNILSTDFDDGSNGANTIPSSGFTPLPNEATTAPGDSGGPIIVTVDGESLIGGVLSGGTTNTSVYGDISWWTGTALFQAEIEQAGGEFLGGAPVVCGNGQVQGGEQCDDGNLVDGDGCNAFCEIEDGFSCQNEPGQPSECELIPFGCSANVVAIPDGTPAGVTDTIVLPAGAPLSDLDVSMQISHTWVGDIEATLTHEDTGTSVVIYDRPGVPGSTFGCDSDNIDVTLDDEAANPVESACSATSPAIGGTLSPNNPLAAFDGEDSGGTWTLRVADFVNQDAGSLTGWCVLATADLVDTDEDGVDDSVDNCTLAPNPDQRDTDGDGFGNACDADLNNDCQTNAIDLGLFRAVFFSADADADFNGDGQVNAIDLGRLRTLFFQPPGPSVDECIAVPSRAAK